MAVPHNPNRDPLPSEEGKGPYKNKRPIVHTSGFTIIDPDDVSPPRPKPAVNKAIPKAIPLPPKSAPAQEPAPKPKKMIAAVEDDDEEEEVEQPKRKKKRVAAVEDEEDEDTREEMRGDEDTEEAPKKRKKKKKRRKFDDDDEERKSSADSWWIVPVALIVTGLTMSLIGAVGTALSAKGVMKIGAVLMAVITLIQFVISVPITIVALMVGGKIFGIEYGTPLQAIAGIAAIGSMMMGLDWFLSWLGLWFALVNLITFVTGFSLFMTLFRLDSWEVWVSIFCIKVMTVISYLIIFFVVIAMLIADAGGGGGGGGKGAFGGGDDDDKPAINIRDDDDDRPRGGKGAKGKPNFNNMRGGNDDD